MLGKSMLCMTKLYFFYAEDNKTVAIENYNLQFL